VLDLAARAGCRFPSEDGLIIDECVPIKEPRPRPSWLAIVMEEEILRDRRFLAPGIFGDFCARFVATGLVGVDRLLDSDESVDWPLTGPALRKPRTLPIASATRQKLPLHLEKDSLSIEEKRRDKTDQDKAERIKKRGKGRADEGGEKSCVYDILQSH
jgi:hypothetical protein